MRIGEWNDLGPVRGLLQRQLGDLGATEYASHVTLTPDTGKVRILVATDAGLLDYTFAPSGSDPEAAWLLRGEVYRWPRVRGLRLQVDAQFEDALTDVPTVWHLI